jgi:hypothetical protein
MPFNPNQAAHFLLDHLGHDVFLGFDLVGTYNPVLGYC